MKGMIGMKQKYQCQKVLDVCGVLDLNDDNKYVIRVEENDEIIDYSLAEILTNLVGEVVEIKSTTDIMI